MSMLSVIKCWSVTLTTERHTQPQNYKGSCLNQFLLFLLAWKKEQYFSPWEPIKDKGLEYREGVRVFKLIFDMLTGSLTFFLNKFVYIFVSKLFYNLLCPWWLYKKWISMKFIQLLRKWLLIMKLLVKLK